jgi:hypothetical protein
MATGSSPASAVNKQEKFFGPVLDPVERSSEVLFGVIMVLTFTASIRVARTDRLQVREILIAALGCNLAWGLIDAIMYIMSCVSERGHNIKILRKIHKASAPDDANRIISDALPPVVATLLPRPALDSLREKLFALAEPPARPRIRKEDWLGAAGVFLLVFLSTFPVILPFLLVSHIRVASRVSDLVAITMLFFSGHAYGRYAGHSAWGWGLAMVAIGAVMVGLTISLGG